LPGLSVILVNKTGIAYEKNFGYADVENKVPFTSFTNQNIGSVSKTLIAIALMKAVELHYFTLEINVNDILPFQIESPNDLDGRITVRELTNHTSGIIDNAAIYLTHIFYPELLSYSEQAFGALKTLGYQ